MAAERKAAVDPSYAPKFQTLLKQSVARVRSDSADVLSDDQLATAVTEYFRWYETEARNRGIFELERSRGSLSHQDWMAKWLPADWQRYSRAFHVVAHSGKRSDVAALRTETERLWKAYEAAI